MRYNFKYGFTSYVAPSRRRELQRDARLAAKAKAPEVRVIFLPRVLKPNRHKRQDSEAREILRDKRLAAKAAKQARLAKAA